jgi:hypothetical protein
MFLSCFGHPLAKRPGALKGDCSRSPEKPGIDKIDGDID